MRGEEKVYCCNCSYFSCIGSFEYCERESNKRKKVVRKESYFAPEEYGYEYIAYPCDINKKNNCSYYKKGEGRYV